jgi:hypothetical protein
MLGFIFHNQYFHMVYYMLLGLGKKPQPGPIRKKPKKKEANGRVKMGHGSTVLKCSLGWVLLGGYGCKDLAQWCPDPPAYRELEEAKIKRYRFALGF